MLGPLTLPPRLVLRALDDLHELAQSAAALREVVGRAGEEGRLDEALDDLAAWLGASIG